MSKEECDNMRSFLACVASKGPQTFSAPPSKEAFEVWWTNEFCDKMRGSKSVARKAWRAALREMGCFEDEVAIKNPKKEGGQEKAHCPTCMDTTLVRRNTHSGTTLPFLPAHLRVVDPNDEHHVTEPCHTCATLGKTVEL